MQKPMSSRTTPSHYRASRESDDGNRQIPREWMEDEPAGLPRRWKKSGEIPSEIPAKWEFLQELEGFTSTLFERYQIA